MSALTLRSSAHTPLRPGGRTPSATLLRVVAGVALLLVWEIGVRALAPAYVAKPSGVLAALPAVVVLPEFLTATGQTLIAVAEGLAISLAFGTLLGLAMGRSRAVEHSVGLYVDGFYALPMVVVLPLVSLWFGYSSDARLATIVFSAAFSIVLNVADGAKSVPREYLEVARAFRSGRLRTMVDIVLPSAAPYLLAGLRLAAGRALIGAVIAEYFTAIGGLGTYILYQSRSYHHNEAFVGVFLLAAFGVGFESLVNWSTRRLLPWYRRDEKTD